MPSFTYMGHKVKYAQHKHGVLGRYTAVEIDGEQIVSRYATKEDIKDYIRKKYER